MKLSVVVPAYNEERELAGSLRSIRAAAGAWERRGWATELIVCDNNSTDRTAAIAREAGALVVFEPVNQIGRARNTGAAHATGEWLVFIDADSHPSAELCDEVAQAIESGRVLAGGATMRFQDPRRDIHVVGGIWNTISRAMTWMAGSFIFCEARAFRELGGFNLQLYAAEELELSRRLKRLARAQGRRVVILRHHPLLTSARKAHLYTLPEMLGFMARTILRRGRTLRSREECFSWYDGRR